MSMKSLLGIALGIAALSGAPGYNVPRFRSREPRYPSINSSYRHVGPVPKGCKKETVRLAFKKDEALANGHLIQVDVDIVWGTTKARAKKLIKYRNELEQYIASAWMKDLQKNEMFIVEPIVKEDVKI